MNPLFIALSVVYVIGCGLLMAVVLLQKKRSGGIGSVSGMGNADTYWDKNKGRSMEGALEKWTKVGGALFFVASFLMCLI